MRVLPKCRYMYFADHFMLSSVDFFKINFIQKCSFRNTIRVSNGLDPDQDRDSVSPDLGLNCLQRLSAELARKELMPNFESKA